MTEQQSIDLIVSIITVLFIIYLYMCAITVAGNYPVRFVIGTIFAMATTEPGNYWFSIPAVQCVMLMFTTSDGLKATAKGVAIGAFLSWLTNRSMK